MKNQLRIAMFGQKRLPSGEGGIEIVVEELCTRMKQKECKVTCYNRSGHHVSGSQFDTDQLGEYQGVRLKAVPTLQRKGLAAVIIGTRARQRMKGSATRSSYFLTRRMND